MEKISSPNMQAGHALAAASEGVGVHHIAAFSMLLLPGAYVALDADTLAVLGPWRTLRVSTLHSHTHHLEAWIRCPCPASVCGLCTQIRNHSLAEAQRAKHWHGEHLPYFSSHSSLTNMSERNRQNPDCCRSAY